MLTEDLLTRKTESIKNVLKKLDRTAEKVLLVIDESEKLIGTITDGDIRRYILKGKSLDNDISQIYNSKPLYIKRGEFSEDKVKDMLINNKIELIPILDEDSKVVDFTTWSKVFSDGKISAPRRSKINIPVVIMAGGKGSRLDPYTVVLPKPLIPIGDKPIIEIIIDEFRKQGASEYYLTLNHKARMIEAYFSNVEKDYKLKFIKEEDFLGTAGSLKLLEKNIGDTFIVSNCDVIVKANFRDVINFHKKHKGILTILSSIQHHKIPYGVIEFKEGGKVIDIIEKPEYTFSINTGVYVLSWQALEFIPKKLYFEMTDLIKTLIKNNKKVITYPVNENDYIDIGEWEEYKKALDKLELLK
jgi:dTDP-glucose pyrophosphorylase